MPGPATVLVNLSIDTSTCFLRRQACEYFIFAQFVSGGFWARDMSFSQLMVQSVLKFFFELSNSSWLPLCHHHRGLSLLKLGGGITPALDGYPSHLNRTPCIWTLTSQYMQSSTIYGILTLICHYCFHPTIHFRPSRPPADHSFPQSLADIHTSHDLGPICCPYHCREKM